MQNVGINPDLRAMEFNGHDKSATGFVGRDSSRQLTDKYLGGGDDI